jgi:hypothetical protein
MTEEQFETAFYRYRNITERMTKPEINAAEKSIRGNLAS